MPERLADHEPRAPRWRIDDARPEEGNFFPGEVAALLGVPGLNHRQLRSIYELVRHQAGTPVSTEVDQRGTLRVKQWRWARFTFLDVVATRQVIRLCLTAEGSEVERLRLHRVRVACDALRAAGFSNPLVELDLALSGGRVVVRMQNIVFDATTGQQRFLETEGELRSSGLLEDPDLIDHINLVRDNFRATRKQRKFEFVISTPGGARTPEDR